MTASLSPSPPLEIPRLVITPSTPQSDPPTPSPTRRPTLSRSQSLMDQIDSSHPISGPASRTTERKERLLDPTSQARASRHSSRGGGPGRGTAASLILVTLAFVLVVSSALLSPEYVAGLLHADNHALQPVTTPESGSGSGWRGIDALRKMWQDDREDTPDVSSIITQQDGGSGKPHTTHSVLAESRIAGASDANSAGPIMSNDAWRSYLRRREAVTGRAGPTAHIEAWDFH